MFDFFNEKNACVFDLDGTLLDTVNDIADATNAVLRFYGKAPQKLDFFERVVGTGVEKNLKMMFSDNGDIFLNDVMDRFDTEYRKHMFSNTSPYPDILNMLKDLNNKGVSLGILSNKRACYVDDLVNYFFKDIEFSSVLGLSENVPAKPSKVFSQKILDEMDIRAQDCLYIGDTVTDIKTALNIGMKPVGVTWGYGDIAQMKDNGALMMLSYAKELTFEYGAIQQGV